MAAAPPGDAGRILVLGNVNVDLVMGDVDGWPAVGTEVILPRSELRPGGSAGNTALALSGMGVPHRLVAAVGDDMMGGWLAAQFEARCSDWIVMGCATTVTVGIVHRGGDRAFFTTAGHLHAARLSDLLQRIPVAPEGRAFAIVSGGFLMPEIEAGTTRLISALRQKGWAVAVDPGWPPDGWTREKRGLALEWLAEADIALINAEEARGIAGEDNLDAALALLRPPASRTLAVKCGTDGARVLSGAEGFSVAAPKVEVIDTVGAGDTFNAAFLAALADGRDARRAGERGVRAASRAISTFPRRYDG